MKLVIGFEGSNVAVLLCAGILGFSGAAAPSSAQKLTRVNGAAAPTNTTIQAATVSEGPASASAGCSTGEDCNDGNACTTDACILSTCVHTSIPGCVPCTAGYDCPALEVVFVVDTSGSMRDEAAALCSLIGNIVESINAQGADVRPTILGITENPPSGFPCLTGNVADMLGTVVPQDPTNCPLDANPSAYESWGPAIAIVADRFPWQAGAFRMVVPMSDEGPCGGDFPDGCNDPGDDRDSISLAINEAQLERVIISPILGTGTGPCAIALGAAAAEATGGTLVLTKSAGSGLGNAIRDLLVAVCRVADSCDDGNFCTCGDRCEEGRCVGQPVPECKPCNATGVCSDSNKCTLDVCIDFQCNISPTYDPELFYCDPDSGELTPLDQLDDGNPCTELVIDACTGAVTHVPVLDRTPCDDGLFCLDGDICLSGECVGQKEIDCSHLDTQCAGGVCNENMNACVVAPQNEAELCDDGDFCTTEDRCQGGVCVGGAPPTCADNNICTTDDCDSERGCVFTNNNIACDDGNMCTLVDRCKDGVCGGREPRDCDDMNACTDDSCHPILGCANSPNDDPCDDGQSCTVMDTCNPQGVCAGTDINNIPCDDNADCFGATCDTQEGFCVCSERPTLCLEPAPGESGSNSCYDVDDVITVNVRLGFSATSIAGGQFFIPYDPALLDFIDIRAGALVDAGSPFAVVVAVDIDETAGEIFYGVGVSPGHPGSQGPAVMAAVRFRALAACTTTELCFGGTNPTNTLLTDDLGHSVEFTPCCANVGVLGGAVQLTCPSSVSTNADAGFVTSNVTWSPPSASGGCGGAVSLSCTGTHSEGASVGGLINAGGRFPRGLSSFDCTVSDVCGVVASCEWSVFVSPANNVEVNVQLSPTIVDNLLFRCIVFEFYSTCPVPTVVEETVAFGGPFNLPGHSDFVQFKVPAGKYECVTARDPKHTLRSVADMSIVGTEYRASFKSDPFFGGNWLRGGNLNDDRTINVVDFSIFVDHFNRTQNVHTPCGMTGVNADLNGDGIVDGFDYIILNNSFLESDKLSCCGTVAGAIAATEVAYDRISVAELKKLGVANAVAADLNGDGWVNFLDMRAFAAGMRPESGKPPRGHNRIKR